MLSNKEAKRQHDLYRCKTRINELSKDREGLCILIDVACEQATLRELCKELTIVDTKIAMFRKQQVALLS